MQHYMSMFLIFIISDNISEAVAHFFRYDNISCFKVTDLFVSVTALCLVIESWI